MITASKPESREQIYGWLNKQAEHLGFQASVLTHQAHMRNGRLYVPVYIENSTDAYENAGKLQELEDTWNYQEPEPSLKVFLLPTDNRPAWLEPYAPVQKAIDRYDDAYGLFRAADNWDEASKALRAMEAAKEAELKAKEQFDAAA